MKERGRFVYQDPDGTICISFERGGKGAPIESLVPPSGRGDSFADFKVTAYFDLAYLVLISPEEWTGFGKNVKLKGLTKDNPVKVSPPPPNLDFLKLRLPNGDMDCAGAVDLFGVVAAYWQSKGSMGLQPGVVAQMWQRGMTADAIIKFISDNTRKNPKTGEPEFTFPEATPEEQLFGALLPPDIPFGEVTKATFEKLTDWLSSIPRGHELFEDQKRRAKDIVFLGLADSSGKIDKATSHTARDFIWSRFDQPANFQALWRHIQASKGLYPAHDPEADYSAYNQHLAALYDQNVENVAMAKAILEFSKSEEPVPTARLCGAAWVLWELDLAGKQRAKLEEVFNAEPQDWFASDNVMHFMRQIFKTQHYGTGEAELEAYLKDNGQPNTLRQIKGFFGQRGKIKTLQEFGVIDENGRWSEVGFQRQQVLAREAHEKDIPPSLEWMRWELHRRHHADDPVPLAWALMNDLIQPTILHRARRLASIALSGGMIGEEVKLGETITVEQYQTLRQIGAWISDPLTYPKQDNLHWLGFLASLPKVNWHNWEQICSFVYDKLDQTPEPELLKDWQDGVVTFEGYGRYQNISTKPFKGAQKIGRNDPCPCGSEKKYKKCCGR